jgi:hypothetical protein
MISNAYETFKFFYDVVLERKKWIESNGTKKKFYYIFLIFKSDFKNL